MNISPISVLLMIMCLCTASCLEEKEDQERKKGKPCRSPKGYEGHVRNEGCIKSTCSNGKWKPTLRSDICCYNQKVHNANTEITKVVGENNCTTTIGCEKGRQLMFKTDKCEVLSTKQQVDELEKNIDDQIGEVVVKIENVNITIGEKVDELSNQVNEKVDELEKNIENMNKTIEEQVDGLYEKVDGLNKNIENMDKTIKTQVDGLYEKVDGLEKNIENMNKTIEEQVDGLHENVDGLEKKIENMDKTIKTQVDGLYEKVDGLEKNIENMDKTIETQVDGLNGKVNGLTHNLHTLTQLVKGSISDNNRALLQIKGQNTILTQLMNNHMKGDPQCGRTYTTLTDAWRRIEYGVKHPTQHCDKTGSDSYYTNLVAQWYRFSFPSAPFAKIPTAAPLKEYVHSDMQSCGTYAVSWMEDSLPYIGQSPKDVTMYFAYAIRYPKYSSARAKIVACPAGGETMYLYYLPPTTFCYSAYCAL